MFWHCLDFDDGAMGFMTGHSFRLQDHNVNHIYGKNGDKLLQIVYSVVVTGHHYWGHRKESHIIKYTSI